MTPLEWVGAIALGVVALAILVGLGWLALLGIKRFVFLHLEDLGLLYHHYSDGWGTKVRDYTSYNLSDSTYRPSKSEVRTMIQLALLEAAPSKKGGKK